MTTNAISLFWLVFLAAGTAIGNEPGDYADVPVDMPIRQVSEHVYYVQGVAGIATDNAGFVSNAAAVVTTDGVVVFDALGTPALAAKFVRRIREITKQPIKTVVLSHFHADHAYGLQVFEDLGADIIAPRGALDYLDAEIAQTRLDERRQSLRPWVNDDTRLVAPGQLIEQNVKFELGDVSFQIIELGVAHSEGDLALHVMPDNVLLAGDLIFEGRVPFLGSANTKTWLEKLQELERSQVKALIPGHGAPAGDPVALISLTRRYLEVMREKMGDAVETWTPFDEAYEAADWSEFIELPAFTEANRSNAYGVYLSLQRELLEE